MLSFGKLYIDITERMDNLTLTSQKIAEEIITHPETVVNLGIEELADKFRYTYAVAISRQLERERCRSDYFIFR